VSKAIQTAQSAEVMPAQPKEEGGGLVDVFLKKIAPGIAAALPKHLDSERMTRICLTAIRQNPDLARCTAASFGGSVMSLSQLGLEPNTPLQHAWLIPRKVKDSPFLECTVMIGYQGYIDLAYRSGRVKSLYAHAVHDGDDFEYELGLTKRLRHHPRSQPGAPLTHAYAVAHLEGADPLFVVLRRADVEARKARGAGGPAWRTDYDAMAMKSAIRALWPFLPKSAEMALATEVDHDEPRFDAPARQVRSAIADEFAASLRSGEKIVDVPPSGGAPAREPGEDDADEDGDL
jgi:recombination protein RecT